MRMTSDDLLVLPFETCLPGSDEFLAATGRLLSAGVSPLPVGSPLHRWSAVYPGSSPAQALPTWRDDVLPVAMSLWGELLTLRALNPHAPAVGSPFEQLCLLRRLM